jgi:predicted HTH domain antitoxin
MGYVTEMETVPLELPAELVKLAQLDQGNLSHETAKILPLDLFRGRKVSLGRAAELCAMPLATFMVLLPPMVFHHSVMTLRTCTTTGARSPRCASESRFRFLSADYAR